MSYKERFSMFLAHLSAGSAFSFEKLNKEVSVPLDKTRYVLDPKKILKAIFWKPGDAQSFVALIILSPLWVVAFPALFFAAKLQESQSPFGKRLGDVLASSVVWPGLLLFVVTRFIATPFTEFLNLVRSAVKAASSKETDNVDVLGIKPIVFEKDISKFQEKCIVVAQAFWTLGLSILVPAIKIKKLVTLEGQIATLEAAQEGLKKDLSSLLVESSKVDRVYFLEVEQLLRSIETLESKGALTGDDTSAIDALKLKLSSDRNSRSQYLASVQPTIAKLENQISDLSKECAHKRALLAAKKTALEAKAIKKDKSGVVKPATITAADAATATATATAAAADAPVKPEDSGSKSRVDEAFPRTDAPAPAPGLFASGLGDSSAQERVSQAPKEEPEASVSSSSPAPK